VVLDYNGRSLEMNSAARAMFATQPNGSPERSLFDALDPAGLLIARQNLDAALQGEVRTFELSFPRPAGRRGTGAVLYAPVRDGPLVSKVLALIRDVTDQKRRESQLQQAEKLG